MCGSNTQLIIVTTMIGILPGLIFIITNILHYYKKKKLFKKSIIIGGIMVSILWYFVMNFIGKMFMTAC